MVHSGTALLNPEIVLDQISVQPGMRVADLGCGRTGHFVFPAAKKVGEKGIVYAVEIQKDILQSIKSRINSDGFTNVEPVWSDIEAYGKTAIPAGSLDVCFIVNVLYLVKDKKSVISEASRLVHKDGLVVIIDWKAKLGGIGPAPGSMVNQNDLVQTASAANLKFAGEISLNNYHFCFVFKKV